MDPERVCGRTATETEGKMGHLDEATLKEWLFTISDEQVRTIHWNRYVPICVNLLTLIRHQYGAVQTAKIAAECTRASIWLNRQFQRRLASLPATSPADVDPSELLMGLKDSPLMQRARQGNGVIVCTYRLGLYGSVPLDIALLGHPVVWPVKQAVWPDMLEAVDEAKGRLGSPGASEWPPLSIISAESTVAPLRMSAALAAGHVVVIHTDGNTGTDGALGDSSRLTLEFFGTPVCVKTGIAKLALRSGAPIFPVIAKMRSLDRGEIIAAEPIEPPCGAGPSASQRFIEDTMRKLYAFLEYHASRMPSQWAGASAVHRWRRIGGHDGNGSAPRCTPDILVRAMNEGRGVRINEAEGVTSLTTPNGEVLVNPTTLMTVMLPAWVSSQRHRAIDVDAAEGTSTHRARLDLLAYLVNKRFMVVSEA